jgi:hypothetical protein
MSGWWLLLSVSVAFSAGAVWGRMTATEYHPAGCHCRACSQVRNFSASGRICKDCGLYRVTMEPDAPYGGSTAGCLHASHLHSWARPSAKGTE